MNSDVTILVVDDELWGREALGALLKHHGYNLLFAEDGFGALEMARVHMPDLVLLDVMMPDMDGFEVCASMRSDPDLAEVPILMVTALDDRNSRLRGIEAGADDFITKPFDRIELRTRIKTITRLNRYRRLQTERVKFQWVVDRAEQGFLLLDDQGAIRYMNAQARLFLAYDEPLDDDASPLFLELARQQYQLDPLEGWTNWPQPATGDVPRFLVRPESEVSRPFWLQVDSVALPQGSGAGILVQLQNVTERINMIREQRTFHALISHRLRTPITMMQMGLDVLAVEESSMEDLAPILEIVKRGANRLQTDVEEVLAYLDAPGPSGRDAGVFLSDLPTHIETVGRDLSIEQLIWTMPSELDGVQLSLGGRFVGMILLEILENSLKFHPDNDPSVEISVTASGDEFVHLTIRDDGIHLSPDQLAQVWNPYYQAEKGFSGQLEGLGLGLSTVSSIVWGVGGRCQMINRPDGPGVEVNLLLPTTQPAG